MRRFYLLYKSYVQFLEDVENKPEETPEEQLEDVDDLVISYAVIFCYTYNLKVVM